MLGGMVPPIAAGVASRILAPSHFSAHERSLGFAAMFKGLLFITEAVLPYLARKRLRIACILGSATAGALSMLFNCGVCAPHGGIFIIPLSTNPLFYLLSLLGGVGVGAILFVLLSSPVAKEEVATETNAPQEPQAATDSSLPGQSDQPDLSYQSGEQEQSESMGQMDQPQGSADKIEATK